MTFLELHTARKLKTIEKTSKTLFKILQKLNETFRSSNKASGTFVKLEGFPCSF